MSIFLRANRSFFNCSITNRFKVPRPISKSNSRLFIRSLTTSNRPLSSLIRVDEPYVHNDIIPSRLRHNQLATAYPSQFMLDHSFVERFRNTPVNWGYGVLSELTFKRTYARKKADGKIEEWVDCVERVINGTFNMQLRHIKAHHRPWSNRKAQELAQAMFKSLFEFKWMPPGRGLFAMGTPITEERGLNAALNNCAFVSTDKMTENPRKPFTFLMDASMCGVGVGYDLKGAGSVLVKGIDRNLSPETFVIPDSRGGWVQALDLLLDSYFSGTHVWNFDYSLIREYGLPIRGFGGVASGPEPLKEMLESIRKAFEKNVGQMVTERSIIDTMNLIGKAVVAGNVRRTAEIAFGHHKSKTFLDLKNYKINPDRAAFGWTSNNSIFAELGMDYSDSAKRVKLNGEPGFAWLQNMQDYGRMGDAPDYLDHRAQGGNPCLEQTLESYELCCLVETFPSKHTTKEEFLETCKYAYIYAKTVTLGATHWPETNQVMQKNRRMGISVSGVVLAIQQLGMQQFVEWLDAGYKTIRAYDARYSKEWLSVPESIKHTSVKPSGTVSLLAGVTPGVHWPEYGYYIRRIRLSTKSEYLKALREAGYKVEEDVTAPKDTMVVEIPMEAHKGVRTVPEVSMWEKLSLAALLQKYWANNQVSCTVTFDPEKEGDQIEHALNYFQYHLKGVSFLPVTPAGAYAQMPYEAISEQVYKNMINHIKPIKWIDSNVTDVAVGPKGCDSSTCERA